MTRSIPITVLTGFLGSGKTTLLRSALASSTLRGTLVLINEAGEIGLDHLLVREVSEQLVLLDSGCLCCTLRKDLVDQLGEIAERIQRGELALRRVVIETSGLADPTPILATLMAHPAIADTFHIDGVVATVDAQLGERNLRTYPESKQQVLLADRLVLTKLDLVDDATCNLIEGLLRAWAPSAELVRARHGAIDPKVLIDLGHLDTRGIARSASCSSTEAQGASRDADEHIHTHADAHQHEHTEVASLAVTLAEPLDFRSFALWVSMLTQLNGSRILRLKAIVHARGERNPIAVQAAQHLVYPPLDLPPMPELEGKSVVVILTTGMKPDERAEIERSLRALVSAAS